jgi:hypothetical protein
MPGTNIVPEWPTIVMFGPLHVLAAQSCMNLAQKASRVPPAAFQAPTSSKITKMNHVWPTACPSCSVMYELHAHAESTLSASSCMPGTKIVPECTLGALKYMPGTNIVPEWQKRIILGPRHVPVAQSCMNLAHEASRVSPAACQAST